MKNETHYQVQSIHRAVAILKLFLNSPGYLSFTEISRSSGLNQATAYRLVATLVKDDLLEQSPETRKYRLGVAALALGNSYIRSNDLYQRSLSKLIELRDECGETVHLAILNECEIVYINKIPGLHPIGLMSSNVGGRSPAYSTAVGKVLLAYLPQDKLSTLFKEVNFISRTPRTITSYNELLAELERVRSQGYAIDQEENEMGVACVATPIFDQDGIKAAVSISGPLERIIGSISDLSSQLVRTTSELSVLFGGSLHSKSYSLLFRPA